MKKPFYIFITVLVLLIAAEGHSQNIILKNLFSGFSLNVSMNYVSSATILLNTNSSDIFERNSTVQLKGGYGYGAALKKKLFDDIYIGISTEYLKITDNELSTVLENETDFVRARVTETVEIVPVELSAYFNIPRFVDNLNIYLGGGFGFYFGKRTERMLSMDTKTISNDPLFSLNVIFGLEYFVDKNLSVNAEMKVRDGKFKIHNQYPTNKFTYQNQTYYFDRDLYSKIYVDGLKMSIGASYYF